MNAKPQTRWLLHIPLLAFSLFFMLGGGYSQTAQIVPSSPARLPYGFDNFVWWGDAEIRVLLKSRVIGLGDEIAPNSATERKVRDALTMMLKEKGVVAEVQSQEPSDFSLTAKRAPGSPPPGIVFILLSPQILVDKVIVSQAPEALARELNESLRQREGREFSHGQNWFVRSQVKEQLEEKGYLDGEIDITHDLPRRTSDHYLVNLLVSIKPGPQYRISSITADGGPLVKGRDLSPFFGSKAGDIAGVGPFGRLAGELRALYWSSGYADVDIEGPPTLDRAHAEASYQLVVIPGPLYHLQSLTIHNLNAEQEGKVRELLGIKVGDVFDQMAINRLYHKISEDPALKAYGFTFAPARDNATAGADLTLNFYKASDKSSVRVQ